MTVSKRYILLLYVKKLNGFESVIFVSMAGCSETVQPQREGEEPYIKIEEPAVRLEIMKRTQ